MNNYIGLTLENARDKAIKENLVWRLVKENEAHLPITMDMKSNRINFEINNNIIIKAEMY